MSHRKDTSNFGIEPRNTVRFASIGECMVEMAPASGPDMFKLGFAGDTLNTAWYVKALAPDWSSHYVSCVGTDAISDKMLQMMTDAGIETAHVMRRTDRSVGLYLISLKDGERSFSYWRDQSAARTLADDGDALDNATQPADVVYFSGITMAILDAKGRDVLLSCIKKARNAGKTIVFDSNLRPRLWASPQDMTENVMRAAAVSDIVLPSFDDEATYFQDADPAATLKRYLDAGATTVVVKNGGGGIDYVHLGASGHVMPPPPATVVDTTSAGDSFNAGFLVELGRTGSAAKAVAMGARVAGHVIGQKGALVPLPSQLAASGQNP